MVEIQIAPNHAFFDLNTVLTAPPRSDADGKLLSEVLTTDWWPMLGYEMVGLRTAARIRPGGWTVEVAIPAKAAARRLGVATWAAGQQLHANFVRCDTDTPGADGKHSFEPFTWALVMHGYPHISPQAMGVLELVEALEETVSEISRDRSFSKMLPPVSRTRGTPGWAFFSSVTG